MENPKSDVSQMVAKARELKKMIARFDGAVASEKEALIDGNYDPDTRSMSTASNRKVMLSAHVWRIARQIAALVPDTD